MIRSIILIGICMMLGVCVYGCQSDRDDINGVTEQVLPENHINKENIDKTVAHIKAGELDSAILVCQLMDEEILSEGVSPILDCIVSELKYYINTDNWVTTKYDLIDSDAIEELDKYEKILQLLPIQDSFTNAADFVSKALKLKKYVAWNDYYKADDTYLTDAMEWMSDGASYKNISWSIAVGYYEEAYAIANSAYIHFSGSNSNGMKEAAAWYKAFSEQIHRTINRENTTKSEENTYNNASSAYKRMITEYTSALTEVSNIIKSFPKTLY